MVIRSVVLSVCLLATAGFLTRAAKAEPTPIREPLQQCPLLLADYRGQTLPPFDKRVLAELGVDEYLNRVYESASGAPVALYIGYYGSQREGDTVHSPKNCLPGSGWEPVTSQYLNIPVANGAPPIEVNRYVIAKGLDRQLVLYWYQSHGRVIASEYWAKIFLTLDAIRLNRTDGALVRVVTPISGSEVAAEREAMQFVQTLFPLLGQYLPG
jgi:EpsI family protein